MAHRPSQPSVLVQRAATVAAPTDVAISFAATTSGHDPYPTEMMRLAGDARCSRLLVSKSSYLQAWPKRNPTNRLQVSISDPLGHMTRYEYSPLN
ncbi:MAG: hypothetical protein WB607_16800 [Candidatus Acidiferrum sp.]